MYDDAVDGDKINNLNEVLLHLCNCLGDKVNDGKNEYNYIEQGVIVNAQDEQGNLLVMPTITHKHRTNILEE